MESKGLTMTRATYLTQSMLIAIALLCAVGSVFAQDQATVDQMRQAIRDTEQHAKSIKDSTDDDELQTLARAIERMANAAKTLGVRVDELVNDDAPATPDPEPPTETSIDWTPITPSADSRLIYVSSSTGDDANDGSEAHPVKTLPHAVKMLRDGHPDHLYLKAGDVWRGEDLGPWSWSGRSRDEPIVVTSYGEGGRPTIIPGAEQARVITHWSKTDVKHVRFIDIAFYAERRDPDSPNYDPDEDKPAQAIRSATAYVFENVVIEGCEFRFFANAIMLNAEPAERRIRDVVLRANIIADQYTGGGHSQGVFIRGAKGLVIEDNVFDHNGWNEKRADAEPTIFNHNIYLKECADTTIARNILARGSSYGLKISSDEAGMFPDLLVHDNLFVANANGLTIGHSSTDTSWTHIRHTVTSNVFTEMGRNIQGQTERFGIDVETIDTATVAGNLLIHNPKKAGNPALRVSEARGQVSVSGNIIYGWARSGGLPNVVMADGVEAHGNDNELHADVYTEPTRHIDDVDDLLKRARQQRKGQWNSRYTAPRLNAWIREGFTKR